MSPPSSSRGPHVLQNRNFRIYWIGQAISLSGTWMQMMVASLVVLALTDNSVSALGVVNFANSLPMLLFMLGGGVFADRWDRRRIMLVTQAVLMALAFIQGALLGTGGLTFTLLLGFSVLAGIAAAFDMPAQQAMVPSLVQPRQIPQAIALNQVIFNGSRLVGPALAGLALASFDYAAVYFINGLSFIAVIISLFMITVPRQQAAMPHERSSFFASLNEGLSYVWKQRLLRCTFAVSGLSVFLIFPSMAVLSAGYTTQVLHKGAGTVSFMMGLSGASALLASFALLAIPAARRGVVMLAGVIIMGVSLLALAVWHTVPSTALAVLLNSLGFTVYMGLNMTTVQVLAPPHMRGRIGSVSGLMFSGVLPFSGLLMAFLVQAYGFQVVYLISAIAYLALATPLILISGMIGFEPPEMQQAPSGPPAGLHGGAPAGVPRDAMPGRPATPRDAVAR